MEQEQSASHGEGEQNEEHRHDELSGPLPTTGEAVSETATGPSHISILGRLKYVYGSAIARLSTCVGNLRLWCSSHFTPFYKRPHSYWFLLLLPVVLIVGLFFIPQKQDDAPSWYSYEGAYRLVPETVSANAAIAIRLPENVTPVSPDAIRFEPELRGSFLVSDTEDMLYFKPRRPLVVGSYYRVILEQDGTDIQADFMGAEDPKILAILPSSESEVHESTEISVLFNRAMVPLTTRTELDAAEVPVRLDPPTAGVWKWKSTRLLQFIPETELTRATTYTVSVREGLRSLDGVAVPAFTHSFTTRTLKFGDPASSVRFNEPLEIRFNQPVDIERTARDIFFTQNGLAIEPMVSYAKKKPEDQKRFMGLVLFGKDEEVDKTRLWIRPLRDKHGREGLWDFDSMYVLSIPKQYPAEGDVVSETSIRWAYSVPPVLSSLRASSERSSHVTEEFFDPEGELVATFFEPVDIGRTVIDLPGLSEVQYAKECLRDEDGRQVRDPKTKKCKEVDNTRELRISVDSAQYPRGKEATLTFKRVVGESGLVLNSEPIIRTVRTIPEFAVSKVAANGLTEITICSSVPLERPESLREALRTEGYVVYPSNPWRGSYRVERPYRTPCMTGEFDTTIRHGLHPETLYTFELSLADEFGAKNSGEYTFVSASAGNIYTRLYSMQKWYNVTVPGSTRLTYAVENLPGVTVHMCKITPEKMLEYLNDNLSFKGIPPASDCTQVRTAQVSLPDTYWVNKYFYFDIKDHFDDTRGHFLVTLTHPEYRSSDNSQAYEHTLLSVSNLTVGRKNMQQGYWWYGEKEPSRAPTSTTQDLYWVLGSQNLAPVGDVKVSAYKREQRGLLIKHAEGVTDADGIARLPGLDAVIGATVSFGNDTAVVSDRTDTLAYNYTYGGVVRTYVYTDRPIYRPGDTVHVRGIDRVGFDQKWRVVEDIEADITVRNSRRDTIHTLRVPVSSYGTFETSFTLPIDAPLGTYRIAALENGYGSFEVEEYVGAPFKAEVSSAEPEYIAGDTAELTINARYYFDMPVADATVEYTVLSQDYYFDRYTDEYFNFGAGWYTCYWCGYGDTFITRGTLTLDTDGKGYVSLPLDFSAHYEDPDVAGSKLYTLIARISDASGKQVVGQHTVIVHRSEYYLGVRTNSYVASADSPVQVQIKSVDTQGAPQELKDVSVLIEKVSWESYKRREVDGGYYWHWEEVRTPVRTAKIRTDKNGNHTLTHSFTESGSYAIKAEFRDRKGNPAMGETRMYVWGKGDVSVRPTNNASLSVVADKPSYKAGEYATILAESPFSSGRALVTVERGDIYEYHVVPLSGGFVTQRLLLSDSYAPGVHASVLLVGPGPEVKYGTVPLEVETDARTLDIVVEPDKQTYLPGEDVVLTVSTKDASGAPVAAEVSVAVVDLSVLALVGNPKKDPIGFFYGGVPLGITTAHSARNRLILTDIPIGTKGGGGGEGDDLSTRKRGDFRDTAHWSAQVTTDASGKATVRFTLPDNLTTWQVESLGVTKDTKLGVHYTEFTSNKRLMAVPIRPRFIVPGDTMMLGIQVMNNTDKDKVVRTQVTSETLTVKDVKEQVVRVPAGKQAVVYFATEAPVSRAEGAHVAIFHATDDEHKDIVEAVIPIRKSKIFESVATAGMTNTSVFESILVPSYALSGQGELTVRAQSTLVASMLSAVREMAGYPYGCSEQIASRLASLAVVRRAGLLFGEEVIGQINTIVFGTSTFTVDEAVEKGLRELLGRQQYNGGFSFYPGGEPGLYLTVEVMSALTVLRDAGYTVDDNVFASGATYVVRELSRSSYIENSTLARVAYALSSPYVPVDMRISVAPRLEQLISDTRVLERLDTSALGHIVLATLHEPYGRATHNKVFSMLENRLTVDARGAYIKEVGAYDWFSSPEKHTAHFVRSVAERGGEHPALENTLRWLRRGMREGGGWGSTNATFTVLDAVLRLAEVRNEHDAIYDLVLEKDEQLVERFTMDASTRVAGFSHIFPLSDFLRDKIERVSLRKEPVRGPGTIYYDMQLRYALPPELMPPRDEGFTVERVLYARNGTQSITEAKVGDLVIGKVHVTVPKISRAVSVESFVPAGFEIVNMRFATEESRDLMYDENGNMVEKPREAWWWSEPKSGPMAFPITYEELHDDRAFVFAERVYPGTYVYEYTLRALVPGTYTHMPAVVSEMYTPENFGRSDAGTFTIVRK